MKILFLYTKRMLAANKARTAVTFAGIVLSFALLTAVLTGTSSLFHFFSEYMKMRDGDYYGVIYNCDEEDEARLAQSGEVMQICRMGIVGVAEKNFGIEHEVSLSNRVYVAIGSVDADFFATMGVRLIEGRLPENDSEVIIPQMMTTAGKEFHIGDTITWQIGERIGSDGRVIQHQEQRIEDRSSADFCEEETIQVEQTKTYTIVGVSTNPGYQKFAEPCYLVLTTGVQTTISDIYLKTKSIDDTSDFIAKNFGDHQSKINETLLRYFGQGVSDIRYMLFGMCAVLMVVVAIASIALIYNSFSISLTERTRQFGLFKSIGATRFQVIVSVFLEAGFLAVSAIPAGLLIGCVGVSCVFRLLKNSFDAMINSNGVAYVGSISMTFYTQVWYLVVAAVTGLITILISAMVPAMRAGRISPIEAIRQTNDIKDPKFARNIRGRGILGMVFGVGGLIAHRNAKRNKKSYRAISFSLAICLFLFLGGSGFIYYMRLSMKGLNVPYYYNYHIQFNSIYNDTFDQEYLTQEFREKLVGQLRTSSSIIEAVYIRKANLQIAMDESNLTDVGKLAVQSNYRQTNYKQMRRKNRRGLLKSETFRCFCSWHFLLTVFGVVCVCMLGIFQTLTQAVKNQQVRELFSSVQAIEQSLVFDKYKSLLVAVLAGLYSYTFARDYNYHNIRNLLVRVSYKDYVITKVLVNIGGTIASVIIGFLLTSFLTIPVMPLESSADISYNSDAFRILMTNPSGAVLYLVLLGTNFGLAAAALTTAGMALSVWSPNSYVAIGGSVLLFYFLYSVSLLLPDRVSFEWISSGLQSLPSENPIWVAVYHLGFLLICNVFSGLFFYYAVRKRYQNGDL